MNTQIVEKMISNEITIENHDKTSWWFHTLFSLWPTISDDIYRKLSTLKQKLWDKDPLIYFFENYYVYNFSAADISNNLQQQYDFSISKRSLLRWFAEHFWWETKNHYEPENHRTSLKHRYDMIWNRNGEPAYKRRRETTQNYVTAILSKTNIPINIELFDYNKYNSFHRAIDQISYILTFAGFWEHPIDALVNIHRNHIWIQAISTIINTLCSSLIVSFWLDIIIFPKISKQTLIQRYKSHDRLSFQDASLLSLWRVRLSLNADGSCNKIAIKKNTARSLLQGNYNIEGMVTPHYHLLVESFIEEDMLKLVSIYREFWPNIPIYILKRDDGKKFQILFGSVKNGIHKNCNFIPSEGKKK